MKKVLWLAIALFIPPWAHAGQQVGAVVYVSARASDGLIYFLLSGTKTGSPNCATRDYWMIRDENSNTGKQQYAMLLAAQAAGRNVVVYGLNSCTRWVDGEDANEIQISN